MLKKHLETLKKPLVDWNLRQHFFIHTHDLQAHNFLIT